MLFFVRMKYWALTSASTWVAALALLPAVAASQASASPIGGEVMFVSGRAQRHAQDGAVLDVAKGMRLREGDTVRTQPDSHVYVRLRDGGLLVVRPQSELKVDLWRFDPAQPAESRIKYTLDSGGARHVSGEAAKAARDKFRFNTPMAAIGVRGTDFTVLAEPVRTQISVQSGGVIVSGLGNGCSAEGLGPCEGSSAVELFAGAKDKKVLQVRMGERRPELIDEAVASDKPRPSPNGESAAGNSLKGSSVDVAEVRASDIVELASQAEKPPPEPPFAVWGRWAAIAAQDPGVVDSADVLNGRSMVAINRFYVLALNPGQAIDLPGAGAADFKLTGHDGVISDSVTGQRLLSTASNGNLRIDFGSRRFDTSLSVQAGTVATDIAAGGSIDANGRFRSEPFVTPSVVHGVVGKGGTEAAYLYQRSFNNRYTASGAASWLK